MSDFLETYELYHHGIKGQKWGVRRYQNPDGSLTDAGKKRYGAITLSSDVVYRRITDDPNARVTQGAFVSYQPKDVEAFRGIFGMQNVQKMSIKNTASDRWQPRNKDGQVYELSFKTNDLTIPSKEGRINTFKEFIRDKKNLTDVQNEIAAQGKIKNLNISDKNIDKAYLYFNECLGRPADENPVNKKYFDFMISKGYDAIVDENDVRMSKTVRANAPLIIINPDAVTDTSIRLKALTPGDIVPAVKKNTWNQYFKILSNQNDEILEPMRAGKDSINREKDKFSENYTLKDLSKDRYVNNMSFKKIEKLNALMIKENISRKEAASRLGYNITL